MFANIQVKELQADLQGIQDLRLNESLPQDLFAEDPEIIHITRMLPANDSRDDGFEFDAAKDEEVAGI